MAAKSEQENLQHFLKEHVNSVSRERIFHNKLFFDLKLAAARARYHLAIFEPEVDRDAFDVFLDDGDNVRRIQVKTVLCSSSTEYWDSTKRFMRPDIAYGGRLGLAPADCGAGGGILLIKIDDSTPEAKVSYLFTDYFVATALGMRLVRENRSPSHNGRGRRKDSRDETATKFLRELARGNSTDRIKLRFPLFVRLNSPDCLLALMNLHSSNPCYLPADKILEAIEAGFEVDDNGDPPKSADRATICTFESHMDGISALMDEPDLTLFNVLALQDDGTELE